MNADPYAEEKRLRIRYTNYAGKVTERVILPVELRWQATPHHTEQWILHAYCFTKNAPRSFALKDIVFLSEAVTK